MTIHNLWTNCYNLLTSLYIAKGSRDICVCLFELMFYTNQAYIYQIFIEKQ